MTCAGVAVTEVNPDMAIVTVGKFAAEGTTALDRFDAAPKPAMLAACTVNV